MVMKLGTIKSCTTCLVVRVGGGLGSDSCRLSPCTSLGEELHCMVLPCSTTLSPHKSHVMAERPMSGVDYGSSAVLGCGLARFRGVGFRIVGL